MDKICLSAKDNSKILSILENNAEEIKSEVTGGGNDFR